MSQESPEQMQVIVSQWQPGSEEIDKAFFNTVVPRLKAIKQRHLRNLAESKPGLSEEAIEKSLDYLENRLRALQAGDTVPIAKIGEEVVGYALVRWEESEKRTQFEQFYVELGRRSQGIGSSLLHQAIHHAETSHIGESRGMFLTTEETNKGGQNLYERFGFHRSQIAAPDAGELRFELDFEKKNS